MARIGIVGVLGCFLAVAVSTPSVASIPAQQRMIDIQNISIEKPIPGIITNAKIALIVPVGMKPSKNSEDVRDQIVDQSLQSLVNGAYFNDSELFDSVKKIEKAMRADVIIGGSEPGSVQHKLEMKLDAFQQRANLSYEGVVHADLKVNSITNSLEFVIQRALSENTSLMVNHQTESQRSFVQMNFDW